MSADDTPEAGSQLLEEMRPWLIKRAKSLTADSGLQQDLAQEGWIAAWKVLRGKNDLGTAPITNLPGLMRKKAGWRMLNVLAQGTSLGSEARPGAPVVRNAISRDPHDAPAWDTLQQIQDGLEEAYHHGEIRDVISSLSSRQREYVFKRFWQGKNTEELKREGYGNWLWTGSQTAARDELAQRLEHLRGMG